MDAFNSLAPKTRILVVLGACAVIAIAAWFLYQKMCSNKKKTSGMPPAPPRQPAQPPRDTSVGDDSDTYPQDTPVDTLQGAASSGPSLVLVYAEWCGHCKTFMPAWDQMVNQYGGRLGSVTMQKVSGPDQPAVTQALNVTGFPTIAFCPYGLENPANCVHYEGAREPNAILAFVRQQLGA